MVAESKKPWKIAENRHVSTKSYCRISTGYQPDIKAFCTPDIMSCCPLTWCKLGWACAPHPIDFWNFVWYVTGIWYTTFPEEQLVMVCLDMFIAGSYTTSYTLSWALHAMIAHPDVQARCYNDIFNAVEKDRLPSPEDRTKYVCVVEYTFNTHGYINRYTSYLTSARLTS